MNIGIETVIKAIGTLIVVMGLAYLIKPNLLNGIIAFFSKGSRLYFAALVRFALAILFFLGARECDVTWLIVLFGGIFLLSGLSIFALGLERAKGIINWYRQQPTFILRVVALVVLGVGLIIVYAA